MKRKLAEPYDSHVLDCDVLEDLAVVHVPDSLVVPNLGGQKNGPQDDPLPVRGADVNLCICQEPLKVDLREQSSEQDFSSGTAMVLSRAMSPVWGLSLVPSGPTSGTARAGPQVLVKVFLSLCCLMSL